MSRYFLCYDKQKCEIYQNKINTYIKETKKGGMMMHTGAGIFFAVLAIIFFVLSFLQVREKGFLLNNAYIWASKKERESMDTNKEEKRPHYRQSGCTFLLLGVSFATNALYCFLNLRWLLILFWILIAVTLIYAVISSIKMELHK